jgi:hypothetical protein
LEKIGKPLGPVEALKNLRSISEVKCSKKRGEPCIPTQQVDTKEGQVVEQVINKSVYERSQV